MKAEVEIAMRMLLLADSSVPPDGRIDKAVDILRGVNLEGEELVKMNDVCSTLHMSRSCVKRLMACGRLARIGGTGDNCLGTSRESLRRFIRGEIHLPDGTLV